MGARPGLLAVVCRGAGQPQEYGGLLLGQQVPSSPIGPLVMITPVFNTPWTRLIAGEPEQTRRGRIQRASLSFHQALLHQLDRTGKNATRPDLPSPIWTVGSRRRAVSRWRPNVSETAS